MNNSYTILNRKISLIIIIFNINILLITILIIWGINSFNYQKFINIHARIINLKSFYVVEVIVPVKEVNKIANKSIVIINSKKYNYSIYKIDNDCFYKNNTNYQKIYLNIYNLDKSYLINNYELDLKIPTEKKKIIHFFKE